MNNIHLPKDDVHGPELPILLHYNLITDPHMKIFKRAIDQEVKDGMRILELGSGSGILSMFAAQNGGVVTSIDSDLQLVNYSKMVAEKNGLIENIEFIHDNALNFIPDKKYDMIICEMQDTACIREKQIDVMNRMLNYLKEDGKVLASGIKNLISLTNVNYNFYGLNIPLPFFDTEEVPSPEKVLSDKVEFGEISFLEYNKKDVSFSIELSIKEDGIINSFMIETITNLAPGIDCGGYDWFNAPYVVPFNREYSVDSGEKCLIEFSYIMGDGLKSFSYKFHK